MICHIPVHKTFFYWKPLWNLGKIFVQTKALFAIISWNKQISDKTKSRFTVSSSFSSEI